MNIEQRGKTYGSRGSGARAAYGVQKLATALDRMFVWLDRNRIHLGLHLRPDLSHRQRHPHQQLLPSDHLELVIGLPVFPLLFVSQSGSLRLKEFATRPLSELGGESLLFGTDCNSRRVSLFKDPDSRRFVLPGALESRMEILAKSRMAMFLFMFAASAALFAQSGGPDKPQNDASVLDARQIVGLSVAAIEHSWQARGHYTYTERDENRRLDAHGQVKSADVDVSRMILVNGERFEQLVEHNGQPPSAEEQRKRDAELEKLKHETPEERAVRLRKDQENKSFLEEVLQAFDFRLVGEEIAEGRSAYVLQATSHPSYRAHGKDGKMFSKVEGKLLVDKHDFGWIKVDGQVTQSFSMGLFVARVQRGSHIFLEQTLVGDGAWVPKRLEVRASAKILFLKSLDIERILTYSDYLPASDGS